jgi:HSP20 family molecular chaperone IbpA
LRSELRYWNTGVECNTAFVDPFEALFDLPRALDARLASDWLQQQTTSERPFPPINVFQQSGDLLAIIELPGVDKSSLQIEAKEPVAPMSDKATTNRKPSVCTVLPERSVQRQPLS